MELPCVESIAGKLERTPAPVNPARLCARAASRATLSGMRKPRGAALIVWLVTTWCAAVVTSHFVVPASWTRSLGTGLLEIPVWVGIGIVGHRRAGRRARNERTGAAPAPGPATSR